MSLFSHRGKSGFHMTRLMLFTLHQAPGLTFSSVTVVDGLSNKTVFTGLLGLSD